MKIKILHSVAGAGFAYGPGEEVEVSSKLGAELVRAGLAEPVRQAPTERAVKKRRSEKAVK